MTKDQLIDEIILSFNFHTLGPDAQSRLRAQYMQMPKAKLERLVQLKKTSEN